MAITKPDRAFANELSEAAGHLITPSMIHDLRRFAKAYARIQMRWCNDNMSDMERARVEKREVSLEALIRDCAASIPGVKSVLFTGDTRGYTVRLMLESGRFNTWGGAESGWGVA